MAIKSKAFIFKHQFVLSPEIISEDTKTVPDLVLSMRDVYRKYVLTGNLEGIAVSPLVQDERLMDEFPEETVDTLLMSSRMREEAIEELNDLRKPKDKPVDEPIDKPVDEPTDKPVDEPTDKPRDIPKD